MHRIGYRPLLLGSILCERVLSDFVYKSLHVPFLSFSRVGSFLFDIKCGTGADIVGQALQVTYLLAFIKITLDSP